MALSFVVTRFLKLVNVAQEWDVLNREVMNPIRGLELTTQRSGWRVGEGGETG
jgi:hypothetical protein